MKIIFLDIDGVLNGRYTEESFGGYVFVSDEKIILLKEIVDSTNANIVLTSTWRRGWYIKDRHPSQSSEEVWLFEALQEKLGEYGLELTDYTEELGHRGEEISKWLKNHNGEAVESYVVIDDMDEDELRPHTSRLIKTNSAEALTESDVDEAIKILNLNL